MGKDNMGFTLNLGANRELTINNMGLICRVEELLKLNDLEQQPE